MSAETLRTLDTALREHLSDEGLGGITTAWVVVANATDGGEEDEGTIWIETPQHQQRFVSMGLMDAGMVLTRGFVYSSMVRNAIEGDE